MEAVRKKICLLLISVLLLCSCQSNDIVRSDIAGENEDADKMNSEVTAEEIQVESGIIQEDRINYEVETLIPENSVGELYYWVFLQNGRQMVSQSQVQEINDRLHELGRESSIAFHIITMKDYVTPEVLEEIYEYLEGRMDFVSIGPALCGFEMNEWKESFIELSNELQNGKLIQFYSTVPEKVWKANQIDGRLLSFSNATYIDVHGYGIYQEEVERYGKDTLLKLQEANGIENKEIWQEIYEVIDEPIFKWSSLLMGKPICIEENPYERRTLSKFTNEYEELYYVYLTDDIRFNIETEMFEWLVESDKYIEIKQTVAGFYEKGYLGALKFMGKEGGTVCNSNTATVQKMKHFSGDYEGSLWVPSWQESRVSKHIMGRSYMYSFVYKEAKEGWQDILNLLGSDEQISAILNQNFCDVTISAVVYQDRGVIFIPDIENQYLMIEEVYEKANPDPLAGFIFNPEPISEEWEEYNKMLASYAGVRMAVEPEKEGELNEPNYEVMDMIWTAYQDMKEKAHIELILEEVNRQYTEWKETK